MRYTVVVTKLATYWYKEGTTIAHRLDGPAYEGVNGSKEWWVEGKYHRLDGPAYEGVNGTKFWYKEGKLHREDGPAYIKANGIPDWYLEGKCYTEKEFNEKRNPSSPTCEGKVVEIDGKKYKLNLV